jgi:hypothetical protein
MESAGNGADSAGNGPSCAHLVAIPADRLHRLRQLSAELADELSAVPDPADPAETGTPSDHGADGASVQPDLRTWFARRIDYLRITGQRSSREDDHDAALAASFMVDRETIRELRKELAPLEWQRPGRPRR